MDALLRVENDMRSSRQNQQYQNTTTGTSSGTTRSSVEETPDIAAYRGYRAQVDPSIGYRVGGAIRRMQSSFKNPAGGYSTPAMRDAIQRSQERSLLESGSEAMREGQYDVNRMDMARLSDLASLTAPRTVQSNETSTSSNRGTGQISQTPSWMSTIGGLAQGAAGIFT